MSFLWQHFKNLSWLLYEKKKYFTLSGKKVPAGVIKGSSAVLLGSYDDERYYWR